MQVFQLEAHYVYHKHLSFSPDGRLLAVGAKDFTLIDTADGTRVTVPEIGCATAGAAFVGGGLLAFTPLSNLLRLLDPSTGRGLEKKGYFFALVGAPHAGTFFASVVGAKKSHIVRLAVADLSRRGTFAKLADTPPIVGSVRIDTIGSRARASSCSTAVVFAIWNSELTPSCMRAPPEADPHTNGTRFS